MPWAKGKSDTMNPIFEAMKFNKNNSSLQNVRQTDNDNRSKVMSMINSMTPQQKAKLKAYTPMLHSLARKFGVSDYGFQKCMNEINL